MEIVIALIIGIVFGGIFIIIPIYSDYVGALRIDHSDPDEEPYLFLELNRGVGDITRKKWVILKVDPRDYISR